MFYCCKFLVQVSGAIKLAQETLFTHDIFWRKSLAPETCQSERGLSNTMNEQLLVGLVVYFQDSKVPWPVTNEKI